MDYLLLFVLGAVIGSFLNVVIYRIPLGKSIVAPPSHCPKCDTRLKPWDLVPLLSWLSLRGRCRYCAASVSYRYALVELLTGLLFVFTYIQVGIDSILIVYLLLTSILIADTFIDFDHFILPDGLHAFGTVAFMLLNLMFSFIPWQDAGLGVIVGMTPLLLLVLLTRGNGMGLGDVKLMAMLGLFLGWKLTLLTLLLSFILGGVFGVLLLATKVKTRKDPIPFGPWIAMAAFIAMHWGEEIIKLYLGTI